MMLLNSNLALYFHILSCFCIGIFLQLKYTVHSYKTRQASLEYLLFRYLGTFEGLLLLLEYNFSWLFPLK